MSLRFFLIDADYDVVNNKPIIRLFGRTEKNESVIVEDRSFKPYFYIIPKIGPAIAKEKLLSLKLVDEDKNKLEIESIEIVKKEIDGKDLDLLKIFAKIPGDVPKLKDALKSLDFVAGKREFDILFYRRYLFDKGFAPMSWLSAEGQISEEDSNADFVFAASKIELDKSIAPPDFKIMAFDIETIVSKSGRQEILMLSIATNRGFKTVITHGKSTFPHTTKVSSEKEIIEKFVSLVISEKPDFLVGYNSDFFDFAVIKERADLFKVPLNIGIAGQPLKMQSRGASVAAITKGFVHIDLYQFVSKVMKPTLKSETLGLENVASELIGEKKHDFDFEKMFSSWKEGKDMASAAAYNMHDSEITLKLAEKILPAVFALSRLTGLVPFDSSRSTYGQLVESFAIRKAASLNIIVPNKPISEEISDRKSLDAFEGAFVVKPRAGLHENIDVFDFRSLYPSIIVSHNIDPYTFNCSCCKKDDANKVPGFPYHFCAKKRGFVPRILEELIVARSALKKKMKPLDKKSSEYMRLDMDQYAMKTVANAFYGFLGFAGSRWYKRESAESVTAFGRFYIQKTIGIAEGMGFETLYGDSITKDRFVPVTDGKGLLHIKTIEDLFMENSDLIFKRGEKEIVCPDNLKALSFDMKTGKSSFSKISEIIRHKCKKKIFRLNQKFGETVVTEDHSIIAKDKKNNFVPAAVHALKNMQVAKITSIPEIKTIDKLDLYGILKNYKYSSDYKNSTKTSHVHYDKNAVWFGWTKRKNKITLKRFINVGSPHFESLCRLLGFYIAEGSSSTRETTSSRMGASISSQDREFLEILKKDYESIFSNAKASIIRSALKKRSIITKAGPSVYEDKTFKLQMMNNLSAVFFKCLCGQKSTGKKLPQFIYHAPEKSRKMILDAMVKGDGSRAVNKKLGYTKNYIDSNFRYDTNSLELASGLSFLLSQMKINHSIRYRQSKKSYTLQTSSKYNSKTITKITPVKYKGYVYDLSVENTNTFVDSCGLVVLHNTDSLFLKPKKESQDVSAKFIEKVNSTLPGIIELDFEGHFKTGIFVEKRSGAGGAKKKYALMAEDGTMKIRGFEKVRRDWASVARETQEKVLRLVLSNKKEEAVNEVRKIIDQLKSGKVPLDSLVIYNQLAKPLDKYEQIGPHVSAAMRAKEKGIDIKPNMVIPYIISKGTGSISDRATYAPFAKNYDASYYINNQVLPIALSVLETVGIKEEDLVGDTKQRGLFSFAKK